MRVTLLSTVFLALLLPAGAGAVPAFDLLAPLAPSGDRPARIVVEATDSEDRPVTGVRVDRAGGGASFAESACGIRRDGTYRSVAGRFEVPLPGEPEGDWRVTVTTGSCERGAAAPEAAAQGVTYDDPPRQGALPGLTPLPMLPVVPGLPALGRASAACGDTALELRGRTRKRVRRSIVCLVNAERRARGLRILRVNRRLERAAAAHARDMRRRGYFAHEGPDGPTLARRLKTARYWPATAGENLGAATGSLTTPHAIVDAWMHSSGHRANMLDPGHRDIGVGVEPTFPAPPSSPGGTYAAEFGSFG